MNSAVACYGCGVRYNIGDEDIELFSENDRYVFTEAPRSVSSQILPPKQAGLPNPGRMSQAEVHTVLPVTHTFIHEWNEPSCTGGGNIEIVRILVMCVLTKGRLNM